MHQTFNCMISLLGEPGLLVGYGCVLLGSAARRSYSKSKDRPTFISLYWELYREHNNNNNNNNTTTTTTTTTTNTTNSNNNNNNNDDDNNDDMMMMISKKYNQPLFIIM